MDVLLVQDGGCAPGYNTITALLTEHFEKAGRSVFVAQVCSLASASLPIPSPQVSPIWCRVCLNRLPQASRRHPPSARPPPAKQ